MAASSLRLTRRATLLNTSLSFTAAFVNGNLPPPEILSSFFIQEYPQITEHGPAWATARLPFLGHTFSGREMCLKYFTLLADVLKVELDRDAFPGEEGFVVDENAVVPLESSDGVIDGDEGEVRRGVVTVMGKGRFRSVKTGRSWEERFMYRLSRFDHQGKIGHWEIWADPLSAWVAVGDDEPGGVEQRME